MALTTRKSALVILFAAALAASGCAALQPPSPNGPRGTTAPVYPIFLTEDSHRREATVVALNRLAQSSGKSGPIETQLQPVTGTILSLPATASSLYLPRVGAAAVMNEEETRESLRRFIKQWQELIGADPAKLSLVESINQPDGSNLANYEQRPFRYPIRGNYGKLQIRFTNDRRVLNVVSTCIPDAERIQSAFSALGLRPKAEDTVLQLREKGLTYTDASGNKASITITASSQIYPRGLVIYILPANGSPDALEFHLAWEIEISNAPVKTAYIDAVSGEVVAAR